MKAYVRTKLVDKCLCLYLFLFIAIRSGDNSNVLQQLNGETLSFSYTMEYYSAIKRNEPLIYSCVGVPRVISIFRDSLKGLTVTPYIFVFKAKVYYSRIVKIYSWILREKETGRVWRNLSVGPFIFSPRENS